MHNGAFKSKESWLKSKYPSRSWELHDKLLMLRKKRPTSLWTKNVQRNLQDHLWPRCSLRGPSGWQQGLRYSSGVMAVPAPGQPNWIAGQTGGRKAPPGRNTPWASISLHLSCVSTPTSSIPAQTWQGSHTVLYPFFPAYMVFLMGSPMKKVLFL